MPPKQGEVMIQTKLKKTVAALRLISPKPSASRLEVGRARRASNSPQNVEDLVPYSRKDLKYMYTLWDEAQRYQQVSRRYRNIYTGAAGVILTGWLIRWTGLSFSAPLGGILMLAGSLTGAWYCLKSWRHNRHSAL
jgi:hypothetical protein